MCVVCETGLLYDGAAVGSDLPQQVMQRPLCVSPDPVALLDRAILRTASQNRQVASLQADSLAGRSNGDTLHH